MNKKSQSNQVNSLNFSFVLLLNAWNDEAGLHVYNKADIFWNDEVGLHVYNKADIFWNDEVGLHVYNKADIFLGKYCVLFWL